MDGSRPAAASGSRDELARRAAGGDVAAFARIVRLHHEGMTRAALVVTADIDRAAAATDAALLDAWLALRHPRTPADLGAWMGAHAVLAAMRLEPGEADRAPDPSPAPLGSDDRAILALREVVGLSTPEIAAVLHRPAAHVAERLHGLQADAAACAASVAAVAIDPIDADAVARRARTEELLERERRVSVVIGLVVGVVVALHPYLLGLVARR